MKRKIINIVVGLGVAAIFLWLATKDVGFREIFFCIKAANLHFVVVAALFYLLSFYARSQKWKLQINSLGYEFGAKSSFSSIIIHYFANTFSIKLGAVFRSVFMKLKAQIPICISLGAFFSENIFDFLFLFLAILFSLFLNFEAVINVIERFFGGFFDSRSFDTFYLFLVFFVFVLGVVLTFVFYERLFSEKNKMRLKNLFFAVKQTFRVKPFWQFIVWQLVLWVLLVFMNMFLFKALFDSTPSFSFLVTITSFVYASWVLPSPGAIGSVEYFSVQSFVIFGLSKHQALSFGFLSNSLTLIVTIVFGLLIISINRFNIFSKNRLEK